MYMHKYAQLFVTKMLFSLTLGVHVYTLADKCFIFRSTFVFSITEAFVGRSEGHPQFQALQYLCLRALASALDV